MLARLNSIVRAIRLGIARKLRHPARGELLYAEGVFGRVLQVRRAVGIAAVMGAAGWVLLGASAALQTHGSSSLGSSPCTGARTTIARSAAGCVGPGTGACSHASISAARPACV